MFITIFTFIIVLSLLVFVHEFGHFWASRKLGVKVEEFGFGFPPRAWGLYKSVDGKWRQVWGSKEVLDASDTIYSLNWLPLGGFCKIKGENGEKEAEPDSFTSKPIWRRITIISAGVIMNVALAAVLFSIGYMVGLPQGVDEADSRAVISEKKIQIVQVLPDTPAERAGLKAVDIVVSIDGNKFDSDAGLRAYVNARAGQELSYKINRSNEELDFKIVPEDKNGKGEIGIAIVNTGLVRYPWYLAIWKGCAAAVILVWAIIVAFYEIIKNLIIGQGLTTDVAGPVGIASLTGQFARLGFVYLLQFTALLSVNLAVINFLPFPALDGGRIIFLLIEKLKGSPVKREVEGIIHNVGFYLLIALIILITVKDVARYAYKFKLLWEKIFN